MLALKALELPGGHRAANAVQPHQHTVNTIWSCSAGCHSGKSLPLWYRFVYTIVDSLYIVQTVSRSSLPLRTLYRAVPMHGWPLRYWSLRLISLGGMSLAV